MENELIVIKQENALEVFTAPKGLDPYIEQIKAEVRAFVPDISTKKGRDAIASIAHKVAKSKTALDNAGKALVDRLKEQPKLVDAERKRMREELDALKDEVRKPLTEWEEAEEYRLSELQSRLSMFNSWRETAGLSAANLKDRISTVESVAIDGSWQEFETEAARAKDACLSHLREVFAAEEKYEADQAELARLRAEAAIREQQEREAQAERDRIAAEEKAKADQAERERVAADNARIAAEREAARKQAEADAKARAEIEAAERAKVEAQQALERAEQQRIAAEQKAEADRIAAQKKAEGDRAAAVKAEQDRQAAEARRVAAEQAARERDTAHKNKINNAAVDALCDAGIDADTAKKVITLIAKKQVPNCEIKY